MHTVKVNKQELLKKVIENRDIHVKEYEEALQGYHAKVIEKMSENLALAQAGKEFNTVISLTKPVTRVKDYDSIISMLQMSVDTDIELDQEQFNNYVRDEWHWSDAVKFSNSVYLSK